jgi:hypothetical protein
MLLIFNMTAEGKEGAVTKKKTLVLLATIPLILALAHPGTMSGAETGFAIRLYGGLGYQNVGDLNTGLKGFSDSIIYYAMGLWYAAGGGYGLMHTGMDLGGDIIFQFSPNIGIGIGSGYLRTSRTSELKLAAPDPSLHDETFTFTPSVSVVPIRASLFVFVPLGRSLKLSLNAGAEYYLASISSLIRDEYPSWLWNEREDKATGRGFGFHGGIGLEIRLASELALILEGQGRVAKINELTGTHTYRNSFGYEDTMNGTLYYWTDMWFFEPFPYVFVNDTLPSDPWQQNPRKAVLDLSGWSAVAGFLFRF